MTEAETAKAFRNSEEIVRRVTSAPAKAGKPRRGDEAVFFSDAHLGGADDKVAACCGASPDASRNLDHLFIVGDLFDFGSRGAESSIRL